MNTRIFAILLSVMSLIGCTTEHPTAIGAIGGAAAGAGIGAMVVRSTGNLSTLEGTGYGALIGIPAGIILVHAENAATRYYILSSNDAAIRSNKRVIFNNQRTLEDQRLEALMERPRGNPDPDNAEYLYEGARIGNPWR